MINNLKTTVYEQFSVQLPILSGDGSNKNPFVLEPNNINDFVADEHKIIKYISILQDQYYTIKGQAHFLKNDKSIDEIIVELKCSKTHQQFTQYYYFDFTQCINNTMFINHFETVDGFEVVTRFFKDIQELWNFCLGKKAIGIASDKSEAAAYLKVIDNDKWLYIAYHGAAYVGDYVKPFKPSEKKFIQFENGVKEISNRFLIFLNTKNEALIPQLPLAFGYLTFIE